MATEVETMVPAPECCDETMFSLEDDKQLLRELNAKKYKEQAVWFLNAFWKDIFEGNREEAENVWLSYFSCVELDPKKEDGCELDQFTSHRLLERIDKALTVIELRETMAAIDLDRNKSMSLAEFLIYKYKVDWRKLVHAPQGTVDEAKLALAEEKVAEAQRDIETCEKRAKDAKQALAESSAAEKHAKEIAKDAKEKLEEATESAKQACEQEELAKKSEAAAVEEEAEATENETKSKESEEKAITAAKEQEESQRLVEEALKAVEQERDAFKAKCDELERISNDPSNGIVKRNSAKAELAQLQCTDPMPLQRAIISHNAVVRKQEKLTKAATTAKEAAKEAREHAEQSRLQAVSAREKAESERKSATESRQKAENFQAAADSAREEAEKSHKAAEDAKAHSEAVKAEAEEAVQKSILSFQEATRFLEKTKKEVKGAGKGKLWWMWRELEESKKYMSKAQLARLEAAPPLDADLTPSCA